jgi:transposase-like protein
MVRPRKYSDELRRRAIAEVLERDRKIPEVARDLGIVSPETLRKWVRQAEVDQGLKRGPTTAELAEIRQLRKEVADQQRTIDILKAATTNSRGRPTRDSGDGLLVDEHAAVSGARFGAETPYPPTLGTGRAGGPHLLAGRGDVRRDRAARADLLRGEVTAALDAVGQRRCPPAPHPPGVGEQLPLLRRPPGHKQLHREGYTVARCTVERLMDDMGIRGVQRGKTRYATTPDATAARPPDLVERRVVAERPDELWLADIERHEALWNRAVVKGHRLRALAGAC